MTDRDALYAAILAHPDEDTPRLVFADYLEEQGDGRYAAFIRKQVELAKIPEWDPLWVRAWNHDRDALTGNGFEQFCPELPDEMRWPPLTSFRRGFPWQVESTGVAPFLAHADRIAAAIPLQSLELHGDYARWRTPMNLTSLLASPHLARMRELIFSLVRLQPAMIRKLQKSPGVRNLTSLAFEYCDLDAAATRAIFQPPLVGQLESLRIEDCVTSWDAIAKGIRSARGPHRLKRFVAVAGSSSYFNSPQVFDSPLLHGLKEFELTGFHLDAGDIRALCESPVVAGLESLTLSKAGPGVPGAKALAGCAALGGLKRLRLWTNKFGPTAMKALAGSPHLSGLRVLDLTGNPVGDKGAIALAESPHLANLVELELDAVGDAGAEALLRASFADSIIYLSISSAGYEKQIRDRVKRKLRKKFGDRVSV
jgi:uncharacterized protein (TIGR02996 family)